MRPLPQPSAPNVSLPRRPPGRPLAPRARLAAAQTLAPTTRAPPRGAQTAEHPNQAPIRDLKAPTAPPALAPTPQAQWATALPMFNLPLAPRHPLNRPLNKALQLVKTKDRAQGSHPLSRAPQLVKAKDRAQPNRPLSKANHRPTRLPQLSPLFLSRP